MDVAADGQSGSRGGTGLPCFWLPAGLRRGERFGLARRHVILDADRAVVRVERTRTEVSGRGLAFQAPKTDAGTRLVVLPDRVRAELRFHDLRHLAGTLTALAGATIKEIQARLGHASPDAAMLYQDVAQGRDGVLAAEIDRLIRSEVAAAG